MVVMRTLAYSEYPYEIYIIIFRDHSIYIMDHPKCVASNQKEESISTYGFAENW